MVKQKQSWLKRTYQVYIRDVINLEERDLFKFNYLRAILSLVTITMFFLGISLAIVNTILAKWLHPAYIEKQNKEKIIQLNAVIDSLEQDVINQSNFIKVMQNAIQGKNDEETTQSYKRYADYYNNVSKKEDALANLNVNNLIFCKPAVGIVTNRFDSEINHYGVDIAAEEGQSIKSISDGVVIMASFTTDTGCVIVIQHSNNLLSVYKHSSLLLKKVGNFVKRGEVIGSIGNSGELSSGPHLHFELWHDGNPVNPELFIKIN
jgi:murein DD-endopeptidase MepM/ murein hydrolase activator NlpD